MQLRTVSMYGCCGVKGAFSELYLVQRIALVMVLLRQAIGRISADERAARVCVTYRVNVGGWWSVRGSCNRQSLLETDCSIRYFFKVIFHLQVPEMAPKTSLCKLVSRKVLDLGGVIKALLRRGSSLPFWREKQRKHCMIWDYMKSTCKSGIKFMGV